MSRAWASLTALAGKVGMAVDGVIGAKLARPRRKLMKASGVARIGLLVPTRLRAPVWPP